MPSFYRSDRAQYRREFDGEMGKRVRAASSYLSGQVKASVSQPGTLRYHKGAGNSTLDKKTGEIRHAKGRLTTVYNFTHSTPGNPPFKQSGNLRQSLAWEVVGLVGRVGSGIKTPKYPLYLELGTRRMKARPYLRSALIRYGPQLRQILSRQIPPGGLPPVKAFQFRSGHLGKGAAASGWA